MQRRRTDKPTEEELRLLTETHRLGKRILELERAAEIDAAHLKGCFENRDAERGFREQLQRDYAALQATAADLEAEVTEAHRLGAEIEARGDRRLKTARAHIRKEFLKLAYAGPGGLLRAEIDRIIPEEG